MDFNQTVPTSDDGCNWLLEGESVQPHEETDTSLNLWNDMEEDVKTKIDEQLTVFRSHVHDILNEQRVNVEYLFGIQQQQDHLPEQHQISEFATDQQCYEGEAESRFSYFGNEYQPNPKNESGVGSYGSDITNYDIDNNSDQSMYSRGLSNGSQEDSKNEYVLRMLSATMRINNILTH